MTTQALSKEKIQFLHDACEEAAAVGIKLTMNPNELLMFTSALLAAHEQEPGKRVNADQMHRVCLEANRHLDKYGAMAKEVNKLLLRHPAPSIPASVPDAIDYSDLDATSKDREVIAAIAECKGWNAYREKLLSVGCHTALMAAAPKGGGE